jgi:hypothetical protein
MTFTVFSTLLICFFIAHGRCQTNATTCSAATTCDSCNQINSCIWCASDSTCVLGSWTGPSNNIVCNDWRWNWCFASTKVLLIIAACIVGLILLLILVCLCRCFCCTKRKHAASDKTYEPLKEEESSPLAQDSSEPQASRHPKTDLRRKELEAKYNIKFGSSTNDGTKV